ncbi:hypothetical protein KIL84_015440 [Mauremys mutica]|uniref:Uncharacterized protein n=1 Tax=Mauremys mutica TaxID=74926 RepID=A0A9D3WRY7_9SAUR|nr:hypothetical protein KIL84_015440 [Mauremys mutica]
MTGGGQKPQTKGTSCLEYGEEVFLCISKRFQSCLAWISPKGHIEVADYIRFIYLLKFKIITHLVYMFTCFNFVNKPISFSKQSALRLVLTLLNHCRQRYSLILRDFENL